MKSRILLLVFSMALPAHFGTRFRSLDRQQCSLFYDSCGTFAKNTSFNAPVIESTGTGGGAVVLRRYRA